MDQIFTQLIQQELLKHAEAITNDVLKTVEQQLKERDEKIAMLEEQIGEKNEIKQKEQHYQRKLEDLLGGRHAKTKYGIIDILTDTTIYEIKIWKNYKNALGQLLCYGKDYPDRQLAKIFFGRCDLGDDLKKEYLTNMRQVNIDVYQVHDNLDGSVSLEHLNKLGESSNSKYSAWFTENIGFKQDSILHSKDLYKAIEKAFLDGRRQNNNQKGAFGKEFSKWISTNYPNVPNALQDTSFQCVKYKGWMHFHLK